MLRTAPPPPLALPLIQNIVPRESCSLNALGGGSNGDYVGEVYAGY